MKFTLLLILLVLALLLGSCTQTPLPTGALEATDFATGLNDYANDVATYTSTTGTGAVYVVGATEGSLDGPNQGDYDALLRKYTPTGTLLWAQQFGTTLYDSARYVATDSLGYVYVAGQTVGSLAGRKGKKDTFLRKYNKWGEVLWTRQFGSPNIDEPTGIAIDASDNIYVSSNDGVGTIGTLRKFNKVGAHLWTVNLSSSIFIYTTDVAVALDGSVYVLGWFGIRRTPSSDIDYNIQVAKYTSDGETEWTRKFGTTINGVPLYDNPTAITTDSQGNVYLSYVVRSISVFLAHSIHLRRYDPTGVLIWKRVLENNRYSYPTLSTAKNSLGNEYIYLSGAESDKFFTVAYNVRGTRRWNVEYSSYLNGVTGSAVYGDKLYIAGYTEDDPFNLGEEGKDDAIIYALRQNDGSFVWGDQ